MVHAPQEDRVAARRRQIRVRLFALHHHHVPDLPSRGFALQLRQLLGINLRRIHFSRRPHTFHRRKREPPVPRPNIRRHCPRFPSHQLRQPLDLFRRVPAHLPCKHQRHRARQPYQQQSSFSHRGSGPLSNNILPLTPQRFLFTHWTQCIRSSFSDCFFLCLHPNHLHHRAFRTAFLGILD